jgi:hypothetical protein
MASNMGIHFLLILILILFSSFSNGFAEKVVECDLENAPSFFEYCGSRAGHRGAAVHKRKLWQGTDHPGYQVIDCKNGTIKNVIDKTGEAYICKMTDKHISSSSENTKINEKKNDAKEKRDSPKASLQ